MKVGIIHDMTETKPINLKKSIFDSIELKIKDPESGYEVTLLQLQDKSAFKFCKWREKILSL